ncbi:hypothetical protein ICC28_19665 [Streptomyces sp. TRM68416]|nr:hypothetical protein [Streptomyces sp. TRM68416]
MSWTSPNGKQRTGIVSEDLFTLRAAIRAADVGSSVTARARVVVIPSDGGEALPLCLPTSNDPDARVKDDGRYRHATPAHHHPSLLEAAA